MRRGLLALALALCVLQPAGAQAPGSTEAADTRQHVPFLGGFIRETRILYPLQVGRWVAQGERRYAPQASGVSVRYAYGEATDRWIDVFFYPVGVIDDAQWRSMAEAEHAALAEARRQSGVEVDMGPLSRFRIRGGDGDPVDGHTTDLGFPVDGRAMSSAMVLVRDRLYVVKGRLSAHADALSRRKARRALESFFREMWPGVTIASTGRCWAPLPVAKLDAAPAPDDILAKQERDGRIEAYLTRDRVLAVEPGSPGAQAMMFIGMGMLGRLVDGCAGDAPVDPEVAEGLREIRIEYRPEVREASPTGAEA